MRDVYPWKMQTCIYFCYDGQMRIDKDYILVKLQVQDPRGRVSEDLYCDKEDRDLEDGWCTSRHQQIQVQRMMQAFMNAATNISI